MVKDIRLTIALVKAGVTNGIASVSVQLAEVSSYYDVLILCIHPGTTVK